MGWASLATEVAIIPLGTATMTSLSEQKSASMMGGLLAFPSVEATPVYFCSLSLSSFAETGI